MNKPNQVAPPNQAGLCISNMAGVRWMKYHGAIINAGAMPVYTEPSYREANQLVRDSRALFIRYSSDAHNRPTNWWNMVSRNYQLSNDSVNTRSKIHRGLKRLLVKRVDMDWLVRNAYDCHVQSYQRYKYASPYNRKKFGQTLRTLEKTGNFDVWVAFHKSELVGYILCQREDDGVFMHTIDLTPLGLHHYAAYAMIHEILDYYINRVGIPVSNGSRNILHPTDIQNFLVKFGFVREYGELHIIYHPVIGVIVNLLYPFRGLFLHLHAIPLFHKISAILQQEQLHRQSATVSGLSVSQRVVKRSFDIVASALGILAFWWLMALCWLLASIDTRRNGVFTQSRVGKNGVPFPILKIRTMRVMPGATTDVTRRDDPRITKLGAIFRRFKLDELPQLVNVLRGDMSFVGPRPDVTSFADSLQGDDRIILSLRPGITGPATLAFRNEEQLLNDARDPEKYNRDIIYPAKTRFNRRYIKEYHFMKDIYYIMATIFPSFMKYVKPKPVDIHDKKTTHIALWK